MLLSDHARVAIRGKINDLYLVLKIGSGKGIVWITMVLIVLSVLVIIVPTACGIFISLNTLRSEKILVRILSTAVGFSLGVALYDVVLRASNAPLLDWNGAKLAPIVGMTRGLALYDDPKLGVMSAWIYGPIAAIVYLPVAIFSRPTPMIRFGVCLSALYTLLPALWVQLLVLRRVQPVGPLLGLVAITGFILLTLTHEGLGRAMYMVGPDAPTLGLIACSCGLLFLRRNWAAMAVSAAAAVLACWCKQSVLTFLAVPPLFLVLTDGFRAAARYTGLLAALGIGVSAILLLSFNAGNMWFHMVQLSAHQHFQNNENGNAVALWYGIADWSADAMEMMLLLLAGFGMVTIVSSEAAVDDSDLFDPPTFWVRLKSTAKRRPWIILLMAAGALLPSSILGYVKVGGYYNNFALADYFLLLTVTVGFIDLWPSISEGIPALAHLSLLVACLFVSAKAIGILATTAIIRESAQTTSASLGNVQETVFDYDLAHPGIGYFPWNPLSTLLAEGKLYHFEWGFVDRLEAGMTPSAKQLKNHLPEHFTFLALPPVYQSSNCLKLFPQLSMQVSLKELPGFHILIDPATVAAAQNMTGGALKAASGRSGDLGISGGN